MTKSTTRISAVFLATVLVAGIIALSSPSFMTGAQAVPDFNNFKKSYGKDVSVKYIKCNNINVNLNGVSINIGDIPGFLGPDVAADAAETGASSFGGNNGGPHDSDNKGVVFVCINNNNNGDKDQIPKTCADCFDKLSKEDFEAIDEYLEDNPTAIGTVTGINSIDALCDALETVSATEPVDADFVLNLFIVAGVSEDVANDLIDCLNQLGLVDEPGTP